MTPEETINRAVCKVKGEPYHALYRQVNILGHDTKQYCDCGFYAWTSDGGIANHLSGSPDYTSEALIREAVRVLVGNDGLKCNRFFVVLHEIADLSDAHTIYHDYDLLTVPKDKITKALLPIAESVLKEGE